MRALLDTHAFLWAIQDVAKLSQTSRDFIRDADNELLISPASYWELAIKISKGNYRLTRSYESLWREGMAELAARILPIELHHTNLLLTMPFHHKDPFDRLLIAQALAEGLPLVSGDPVVDAYGVQRIW